MPAVVAEEKKVKVVTDEKVINDKGVVVAEKKKEKVVIDEKVMAEKYYLYNDHCVDVNTIRFWQKRAALVRLCLTLPILFLFRYHPIWMVMALQMLDMNDSLGMKMVIQRWRKKKISPKLMPMLCQNSFKYQAVDKLIDILSYIVAVGLLQRYCFGAAPKLLWALIGWRMMGVALFCKTRNAKFLILFADMIKEMIVLHALIAVSMAGLYHLGWVHQHTLAIVLVVVALKVGVEAKLHRAQKWVD